MQLPVTGSNTLQFSPSSLSRATYAAGRIPIRFLFALSSAIAGIGFASPVFAGFTPVSAPAGGEASQAAIFDHVYGGAFSLEGDGVDYTNGSVTAVRVSDSLPSSSTSDNPGPTATDQLWQAGEVQATAEAAFASWTTSPFGFEPGTSGGTFQSVFGISGSGFAVSGSGTFLPGAQPFRFAASNEYGQLSSLPSENDDGKDHMISYEIDGLNGDAKTWLLFFDDYGGYGNDPDSDFNDLVVQVKTLPLPDPQSSSIPEPGSLLLVGGLTLGLLKRVRRTAK